MRRVLAFVVFLAACLLTVPAGSAEGTGDAAAAGGSPCRHSSVTVNPPSVQPDPDGCIVYCARMVLADPTHATHGCPPYQQVSIDWTSSPLCLAILVKA